MTFPIQIIIIVSPFVSAILATFLTYQFSVRGKRLDILYANKIPAFKDVASKITVFKNFCEGRVAYIEGNEFSAFYEEDTGTLAHRTDIAQMSEINSIFLSTESRRLIAELLNQMAGLCNIEMKMAMDENSHNQSNEYARMARVADSIVEALYDELNLERKSVFR